MCVCVCVGACGCVWGGGGVRVCVGVRVRAHVSLLMCTSEPVMFGLCVPLQMVQSGLMMRKLLQSMIAISVTPRTGMLDSKEHM